MMTNTMNQQSNFPERLQNGGISSHPNRGQGTGSNIQAVDMDVNEILKVLFIPY